VPHMNERAIALAALFLAVLGLTSCHRPPDDPSIVILQIAHWPMTTKDTRIVDLRLSGYEKVDPNKGRYRVVPRTTVRFSIPAKFLVSKWNLQGGRQASIFIETRANTRDAWEDCIDRDHGRPRLICAGDAGRLIVVNSAILRELPAAFTPDRQTFPDRRQLFSSMWDARPGPRLGRYQVEFYESALSEMAPRGKGLVEGFDPYQDNFYMRPIDYADRSVEMVDCSKIQTLCKAYLFYGQFIVTFAVQKAELPRVTQIALDVRKLLDGFAG